MSPVQFGAGLYNNGFAVPVSRLVSALRARHVLQHLPPWNSHDRAPSGSRSVSGAILKSIHSLVLNETAYAPQQNHRVFSVAQRLLGHIEH
jgi:hypothetical protein